jgi:hypothetical protein
MEKNSKNKHQSTVITLNFNDNNYQFSTELAKPIETFYFEICAYLQINPKNFLLYYNSNFISFKSNPNQKIFDIIDNNPNSIFKIVPKKTKTINLRYQTIDQADNNKNNNNNINSRNRYNELSFSSKSVRSNLKLLTKNENKILKEKIKKDSIGAIITKFPSVKEVEKILEDFNMNNMHFPNKKGVMINLGNDSLRVDFNNEAYLNEFISYVSFIKYENPHFKNLTIKKDVSSMKLNKKGLSNKLLPNIIQNFDKKYDYNNNNLSKSVAKPSKMKLKIKINDVIKALKHNELNKDTYHGLTLDLKGEDEIITDYYQQQSFLRNSSPYITEHEKQILEEKENKKHFFKHKNFVTSVGKYSMKPNFISNYVGLTPGENPKNHEFREVDKNKWMNKKGFNI